MFILFSLATMIVFTALHMKQSIIKVFSDIMSMNVVNIEPKFQQEQSIRAAASSAALSFEECQVKCLFSETFP